MWTEKEGLRNGVMDSVSMSEDYVPGKIPELEEADANI